MELYTQQYILSQYRELNPLNKRKKYTTHLARSELDGSHAIKKQMDSGQANIYRQLQDCPLTNVPKVLYVLPFPIAVLPLRSIMQEKRSNTN